MAEQDGHDQNANQRSWQQRALYRYYQSRPGWVDGTERFWNLIRANVSPGSAILEIGAGPSNKTTRFLAEIGEVTGIDLDPAVATNESCAHAHVYDGRTIPVPDLSFDACVANYVLEHVEEPAALLRECHRVLRPGGVIAFRTPNLWHYVSLIARLTPQSFHERVALRAQNAREDAHDPYPTFHRMNTRRTCTTLLESGGFECDVMACLEGEPSYGLFSPFAFYPMMLWERILNSTDRLEDLRANIFCIARKLS